VVAGSIGFWVVSATKSLRVVSKVAVLFAVSVVVSVVVGGSHLVSPVCGL
jgi:hypothetical protein